MKSIMKHQEGPQNGGIQKKNKQKNQVKLER